jgi:DNA-binding NtrC family response regulator
VSTVAVVADDLIWLSRLQAAVQRAGSNTSRAASVESLRHLLNRTTDRPLAVVVDLNGRGYDGVALVAEAAGAGLPTIAVGQHEDLALRRRALDAGARRVYSYNKMHTDGPRLISALLESTQQPAPEAVP